MPSPPAVVPALDVTELVKRYLPSVRIDAANRIDLHEIVERQLTIAYALLGRALEVVAMGSPAERREALRESEALGRLIALVGHALEGRTNRAHRLAIAAAKARVKRVEHLLHPDERRHTQYDPIYEDWRVNTLLSLPDACFADDDGVRDQDLYSEVQFGMPLWLGRALRGYEPLEGEVGPFRSMADASRQLDWPKPPRR
ncbi:MAG: hypothetical protein IT548_03465 [Alphaproteobacteria bacterium]|nr:hypothetical protein [Alphaproteobacteria bacterium]